MIERVGDIKVTGSVQCQTGRNIQTCAEGRCPIAGIARKTIARHGCDDAIRIHFTDAIIMRVRNIKIPRRIKSHAGSRTERGIGGKVPVVRNPPRHGRDDAVRSDLADAVVASVRNQEIAEAVHGHVLRTGQIGVGCGTAITGKTHRAIAGNGGDDIVCANLANAIIARIHNEQIMSRVHRHPDWQVQRCVFRSTPSPE